MSFCTEHSKPSHQILLRRSVSDNNLHMERNYLNKLEILMKLLGKHKQIQTSLPEIRFTSSPLESKRKHVFGMLIIT